MEYYIIDTSIFTNILDIPSKNEQKDEVTKKFCSLSTQAKFIVPITTIIETGNHIAQNGDGNVRRSVAEKFCKEIRKALKGETPYTISPFPKNDDILTWLDEFPDYAGKNKNAKKTKYEGTSMGDLLILKEVERLHRLDPEATIKIWSLDSDLVSHSINNNK